MTRLARTPISRAASKSALAARTEIPNSVRRNTKAVIASTTTVTAIVTRSITSKRIPATSIVLNTQPGSWNDFLVGDTNTAQEACDSCSRANEASSSVNGLAPRSHRNTPRSITSDASTATTTMAGAISHQLAPLVDRK